MTRQQFVRLNFSDRARAILRQARFVTTVEHYNYQCDLYAIEDFFIEVKLTTITNEVQSIHLAQDFELEKFINQIDLPVF